MGFLFNLRNRARPAINLQRVGAKAGGRLRLDCDCFGHEHGWISFLTRMERGRQTRLICNREITN